MKKEAVIFDNGLHIWFEVDGEIVEEGFASFRRAWNAAEAAGYEPRRAVWTGAKWE